MCSVNKKVSLINTTRDVKNLISSTGVRDVPSTRNYNTAEHHSFPPEMTTNK